MLPQIRPYTWRGRGAVARAAFAVALVVGAPIMLAIGLVLLVLAALVWVVAAVGWLVGTLAVWVWFTVQRMRRIPYPFRPRPPVGRSARTLAFSSLYLTSAPRIVGASARLTGFLLGPMALLVSLVGLVAPRWRARPYVAVFTLAGILRKAVGLGNRRGLLRDGQGVRTLI